MSVETDEDWIVTTIKFDARFVIYVSNQHRWKYQVKPFHVILAVPREQFIQIADA